MEPTCLLPSRGPTWSAQADTVLKPLTTELSGNMSASSSALEGPSWLILKPLLTSTSVFPARAGFSEASVEWCSGKTAMKTRSAWLAASICDVTSGVVGGGVKRIKTTKTICMQSPQD